MEKLDYTKLPGPDNVLVGASKSRMQVADGRSHLAAISELGDTTNRSSSNHNPAAHILHFDFISEVLRP